jgi:hypothetical protein
MKIITILFGILVSFNNLYANEKLGQINDPDGYTNVREQPTTKSKILFKIETEEYFYYESSNSKDWCKITNMDGMSGFMHQSKISNIKEFTIKGKTYKSNESKLKIRKKNIGNTQITIFQIKNPKSNCDAFIDITSAKIEKSYKYESIEAVGGSAGIAFLENVIPNHVLIVKHGDSNGRTIIVSKKGNVLEIPGGSVSTLINEKYLLNFKECDIGYCGFSVYDILQEKIIHNYEEALILYEFENKIIFDLDVEDGKDYNLFDIEKLQFKKIKINTSIENNPFERFIEYELKDGCLCY